jgi:hypothetical protein
MASVQNGCQTNLTTCPTRYGQFSSGGSKTRIYVEKLKPICYICGGREKVGKSNNFKNELTMFTP